jgi:heme exporter protein C
MILNIGFFLSLMGLVFLWVPTDAVLGISQRIFYYHVPLAWVGFLAFSIVFVCSCAYLAKWSKTANILAYSAAETGILFISLALLTGVIWSKAVWGVWWTWAPQQTTTLILWLIYVAYMMIRAYGPSGIQGSKYAAVLGIIGFFDVPLVYMAGKWWRDIHPEAVIGPLAEDGSLESSMRVTLLLGVVAFTLLFGYLLRIRYTQHNHQELILELGRDYE